MKTTLKKIAMILVMVMLCNMSTSCVTASSGGLDRAVKGLFTGIATIFIGALVVGGIVGLISGIVTYNKNKRIKNERGPRRTNPYIFENNTLSTTISSLSEGELSSLKETLQSFPENELNSFIDRLYSLSEEESVYLMDSINSFSVQELSAILETLNSMSETEKISSIMSLNSLPETVSLANIVWNTDVVVSEKIAYVGQRSQY